MENRKQTILEFNVDDSFNEFAEGFSVEFMAGDLSLNLPGFTVGIEDTVAEKLDEVLVSCETFVVAREVSFENVLHHGRVCREDLAGTEGAVEDEGGGRDGLEDIRYPLYAAVEVGGKSKSGTENWIRFGNGGGRGCF